MTKNKIEDKLKYKLPIYFYDVTDSTNKRAKQLIAEQGCERALIVANGQTVGRGRLGRSFYSPKDTGIYMTYILRTDKTVADALRVTTATAVAVARAIGDNAMIKWVNDIYVDGKKVCGILTEAVADCGRLTHVIIGIGINITTSDFPDDIKDRAGNIGKTDKSRLVADICDNLHDIENVDFIGCYRERLLWRGKEIVYLENNEWHGATLLDIDDECGLVVAQNGNKKTLRSGEISINKKEPN